jgi:hypothetical protein
MDVQVTLKIAVRIDEILGKPDQSNLEAPPIQVLLQIQ